MQIITGTDEFYIEGGTAVGIGKFDGVHLGHQTLMDALRRYKEEKDPSLKTAVFTFDPTPEFYFSGGKARCVTTREEKREILSDLGIDVLVEYPFREDTAGVLPEDFLKNYVVKMLQARFVAAGEDLSFGYRGLGDFSLLDAFGKEYGYETKRIEKLKMDGEIISSTRIREAVEQGEMEKACAMLGRPYAFLGRIMHGQHLGTSLGTPTINMYPAADKCLPPFGVYYSRAKVGEKVYAGLTNVGVRPTVTAGEKEAAVSVETFLFDCQDDLYDLQADVQLLSFKRPEQRFANEEELAKAIRRDIEDGKAFHAKTP
ncbi:MAG: bifunctional riboflavin kinase/FAD synthetase [Lachnospiraceae bacterium]|nr:bifunctional riboflavin kinase/FAD synthetase [Lachnospiraceae bacterium]